MPSVSTGTVASMSRLFFPIPVSAKHNKQRVFIITFPLLLHHIEECKTASAPVLCVFE